MNARGQSDRNGYALTLPQPIPNFRVFFLRRWLGMVPKVDGRRDASRSNTKTALCQYISVRAKLCWQHLGKSVATSSCACENLRQHEMQLRKSVATCGTFFVVQTAITDVRKSTTTIIRIQSTIASCSSYATIITQSLRCFLENVHQRQARAHHLIIHRHVEFYAM